MDQGELCSQDGKLGLVMNVDKEVPAHE